MAGQKFTNDDNYEIAMNVKFSRSKLVEPMNTFGIPFTDPKQMSPTNPTVISCHCTHTLPISIGHQRRMTLSLWNQSSQRKASSLLFSFMQKTREELVEVNNRFHDGPTGMLQTSSNIVHTFSLDKNDPQQEANE